MPEAEAGQQAGDWILEAVEDAFDVRPASDPRPPPAGQPLPGPPLSPPGSPQDRRDALTRMQRPLRPEDAEIAVRVMLTDPKPDLRLLAAQALAGAPFVLAESVVQRALKDPDDAVRAEAVRLAARLGRRALRLTAPLVTDRRWPMAQQAALRAMSGLIRESAGPGGELLEGLLRRVGDLDPPPLRSEQPGLQAVAAAIGNDRLIGFLDSSESIRLGAARMLLADAAPGALRAVAALADDPAPEVRRAAAAAEQLMGVYPEREEGEPEVGAAASIPPASRPPEERSEVPDHELIAALALALRDPEEAVRGRARAALGRIRPAVLSEWAARELAEGSNEEAASAAALVELVDVPAPARALFYRACSLPPEARGPYLGALTALGLAPEALAELASATPPTFRQGAVRLAWQLGGRAILSYLSTMLEDTSGAVRLAALEVFAESADPFAVEVAERMLASDSSAAVRAMAVQSLARAGSDTRALALTTALDDPDPDVRATAIEALPPSPTGELARLLLPALRDGDERVWRTSLDRLAGLSGSDLPVLWAGLRESPPAKREELIRAIERIGSEQLARLARENASSPDPEDRATAIELAARAGTPEATAQVVGALTDPDPHARRTAAAAMSTLRTPGAVEALSTTLSDPHAEVRIEAVRALGLIDDDGVPAVLIEALKDPEVRVRDMAAEALTRWHSPAVARRLAAALSSADLRRPAGRILEHMGGTAVQPLVEVATGPDVEAVAAAGSVLERLTGVDPFVSRLSSLDPVERLRSATVLGAIGGTKAVTGLLTALGDPDVRVRSRAASLLGAMGESRAIRPLRRAFLTDPVGEVSAAAEAALRLLGSVPPAPDDVQVLEDVPEDQ